MATHRPATNPSRNRGHPDGVTDPSGTPHRQGPVAGTAQPRTVPDMDTTYTGSGHAAARITLIHHVNPDVDTHVAHAGVCAPSSYGCTWPMQPVGDDGYCTWCRHLTTITADDATDRNPTSRHRHTS